MFLIFHQKPGFYGLVSGLASDRRGVTAVIMAIAFVALLGFCGLAIDVVMWEINQRNMQGAADQAALAAAAAYRSAGETGALGDSATSQNAAYATAIRSGYPSSAITVAAYNNGSSCTNDGCLQVTISQQQPQYFTAIFLPSVSASASSVGTCNGCGNGSFAVSSSGGDPCVMALDPSGSGVFTLSGTPTMSLTDCNMYNNSPNTNATILNGSAVIEGCSATNACGSKAFLAQPDTPSGSIDIPITLNAAPAPDPYANLTPPTPAGSCSSFPANPVHSGTYCPGNINNQSVTFATGSTIIITGGLSLKGNSDLACGGCTLYVLGGASINANSTMSITAPSTGSYAGMAVWFGDSSSVTWNGGNDSGFKGAIYAPSATVDYGGNAASTSTCTRLIAKEISLHGTSTASFNNNGCPAVAGPVLTASGVSGSTTNTGSPMLVQ